MRRREDAPDGGVSGRRDRARARVVVRHRANRVVVASGAVGRHRDRAHRRGRRAGRRRPRQPARPQGAGARQDPYRSWLEVFEPRSGDQGVNVNLDHATEVLTIAGIALLLLPPFKGKKATTLVVGGALAALAVLLLLKHLTATAS